LAEETLKPNVHHILIFMLDLLDLWKYKELLISLVRREISSRYKGSVFGVGWSFLTPAVMLVVYTFVFSEVFKIRWGGGEAGAGSKTHFATMLFAGLVVLQFTTEVLGRSASIVLQNPNYVRKVVFPLEILPLTVVGSALVHSAISLGILMVASAVIHGGLQIGIPCQVLHGLLRPLVCTCVTCRRSSESYLRC
jgi:lipopolysaccharide transport system permease protein